MKVVGGNLYEFEVEDVLERFSGDYGPTKYLYVHTCVIDAAGRIPGLPGLNVELYYKHTQAMRREKPSQKFSPDGPQIEYQLSRQMKDKIYEQAIFSWWHFIHGRYAGDKDRVMRFKERPERPDPIAKAWETKPHQV
jgi:hypothetical protein